MQCTVEADAEMTVAVSGNAEDCRTLLALFRDSALFEMPPDRRQRRSPSHPLRRNMISMPMATSAIRASAKG